jgi:DUF4097 and DUF4098 domain-containing protein YvlB
MKSYIPLSLVVVLATLPACGGGHNRVNGSVSIGAGEAADELSTVNGGIEVKAGAAAREVHSVNGGVKIGDSARATSVATVNGSVSLGNSAEVKEGVHTVNGAVTVDSSARVGENINVVNGAVTLRNGADVHGNLHNVNGRMDIQAAHVGGGLETVNGDIRVGANSKVDGGILIKKQRGFSLMKRVPRVVIGPGAVVQGKLRFERPVKLYVSDSASIGPVEGATALKFSGTEAPE